VHLAGEEILVRDVARHRNQIADTDEAAVLKMDARTVGEEARGVALEVVELVGDIAGAAVQDAVARRLTESEGVAFELHQVAVPVEDDLLGRLGELDVVVFVDGEGTVACRRRGGAEGGVGAVRECE